jgi:CO dehydrogenase maturation factor
MTTTIAISGKGGSGKTTIAAMIIRHLLEQALHQSGTGQAGGGSVLAVDADPNSCLGLTLASSLSGRLPIFVKMRGPQGRALRGWISCERSNITSSRR